MKKQTNILFAQISAKQLDNLTSVVNETLAPGFNSSTSKSFTAVDLWKIQSRVKSSIQRRRFF